MKAQIKVTLKKGVLDPQGRAIHHALEGLGFSGVNDVRAGRRPDNFMPPAELSEFERSHLRDAFVVVRTMQSSASSRGAPG